MKWLLLACILTNHLLGLLLWRRFTSKEVDVNKSMIESDGSGNTLGNGFHQRRTWLRFWHWLATTAEGALPAAAVVSWAVAGDTWWWGKLTSWEFWQPLVWSFAALGVLLGGYFLRTFSPMLNASLNLPYKPRFYVSASSTASKLDKFVWWLASKVYGDWTAKPDYQAARAALLLQALLNVALVITLVVYVLLLVPLSRSIWN